MLKFFFHRSSPVVYLMNFLALGEIGILLFRSQFFQGPIFLGWASLFLIFTWGAFNLLNLINWYPGHKGKLGIRLHFQKNLVPTVYLSAWAFALKVFGFPEWVLLPVILLVLPMYYVAIVLLVFHFRDTCEMKPGYFSRNFYLQEEETL